MKKSGNIFGRFFGVIIRGQTYLNILYILLALPLGVFYYVFLAGGIILGVPLVIVFIGILVLIAVFAAWVAFIAFERQLAIWLLRVDVPPYIPDPSSHTNWISGLITNRVTWTGLLFLFLKLPLGVFSLTLLVVLFSTTVSFLSAPFIYTNQTLSNLAFLPVEWTGWEVDTLYWAVLLFVIGLLMIFLSLHILNIIGWVWGVLSYWMLGRGSKDMQEGVDQPTPVLPEPVYQAAPVVIAAETESQQRTSEVDSAQSLAGTIDEDTDEVEIGKPDPSQPLITPPPESPKTRMIDESDLPSAKSSAINNPPPAWLLEEEGTPVSDTDGE